MGRGRAVSLELRMSLVHICSACGQGESERIPENSMPRKLPSGEVSADFCLALGICPACNAIMGDGWSRKEVRANLVRMGFEFAAPGVTMCPPASASLPFDWIQL